MLISSTPANAIPVAAKKERLSSSRPLFRFIPNKLAHIAPAPTPKVVIETLRSRASRWLRLSAERSEDQHACESHFLDVVTRTVQNQFNDLRGSIVSESAAHATSVTLTSCVLLMLLCKLSVSETTSSI